MSTETEIQGTVVIYHILTIIDETKRTVNDIMPIVCFVLSGLKTVRVSRKFSVKDSNCTDIFPWPPLRENGEKSRVEIGCCLQEFP